MTTLRNTLSLFVLSLLLSACVKTPISGTSAFILTSESEENELGLKAYSEILRKSQISKDPRQTRLLLQVGSRIASVANKPDYQWEFNLIESKEKNAFCLPGGKIAVYTGILSEMQNEAQLATVMGHEVAHAIARHAGQRITLQYGEQLSFAILSGLLDGTSSTNKTLLMGALGIGAAVGASLPFNRSQESEADYIGLIYMAMAGYEPTEAEAFWTNFAKQSGKTPEFLSDHPASDNRAEAIHEKLPEAQEKYSSSPRYGKGDAI